MALLDWLFNHDGLLYVVGAFLVIVVVMMFFEDWPRRRG